MGDIVDVTAGGGFSKFDVKRRGRPRGEGLAVRPC